VHALCLGKTDGAAHQPFDPGPQIDGLALDFLRVLLTHPMLIRVIARNAKRLQQRLQLEKHGILAAPEDVG